MKKVYLFLIIMFMLLASVPSNAETPDVNAIINKVKTVWDIRPISFKVTIIVKNGNNITGKMIAGAAHKSFKGSRKLLIVILEPESLKGVSYLLHNFDSKPAEQWIYMPYINRVRKLSGISNYESFLSTDFTYADLMLIDTQNEKYKYLGEEDIEGVKAYKIESLNKDVSYFYSKIVNLISKDTYQILRRDYYAPDNSLWKRSLFDNLTVINGMRIPLRVRMLDLPGKTSTEINISEVGSDMTVPDDIFVPEQLEHSLDCPVWQKVCYPKGLSDK